MQEVIRQAGRIAILPTELANQIAAGEVVERPASAVKELVENAIDAQATQVDITIAGGGAQLIEVRDNGQGMSRQEATLCVERHATSKIRQAEDLYAIASLGFRGEALPSIASVSRFKLVTRRPDDLEGTAIEISGGQIEAVRPAACPPGTEVTVRDLFFNTPARLKFLKTEQAERRQIVDAVARLALGQPQVYLRLVHQGNLQIDAPPANELRDRASSVLGHRLAERLYPILPVEGFDYVEVNGLLGDPQLVKRDSGGIYLYVNGRFVRDRKIQAAIMMAYAGLVDRGLYPTVILQLALPPQAVDVNVHPTKAEVRFHEPDLVFRAVRRALLDSLASAPWLPESRKATQRSYTLREAGAGPLLAGQQPDRGALLDRLRKRLPDQVAVQQTLPGTHRSTLVESSVGGWWATGDLQSDQTGQPVLRPSQYFRSLKYIGQLGATYLVCQDEEGLALIDQHAAHERILFERLKDTYAGHHRQVQSLLLPVQLELDRSQLTTLEEYSAFFTSCGFEIEPFSASTVVIRAVPAVLVGSQYDRLIREALDELASSGQSQRLEEAVEAVLSRMACHGSVRGGDQLAPQQVQALLAQLDDIDFRGNCPHGRPVLFRVSYAEIEKRFERQ
ncbi:MAG: DNA mismatch repair endonuclease MutL [Bradymonadales bacterium]|nr:DNA mismatch repair endonuclease MutL [Bradymonadales bacterium]